MKNRRGEAAFLDIETTGLNPSRAQITVIGIGKSNGKVAQLIGRNITKKNLQKALRGIKKIVTYNGEKFDFPFIERHLGIDLKEKYKSEDLMYKCWEQDLYGGLKKVEKKLGISRDSSINGEKAVQLWYRYNRFGDKKALKELVDYNKEDVLNLSALRKKFLGEKRYSKNLRARKKQRRRL